MAAAGRPAARPRLVTCWRTATRVAGRAHPTNPLAPRTATVRRHPGSCPKRDPSYDASGGVAYPPGSPHHRAPEARHSPGSPRARPTHKLFIKVYTCGGATGTVAISTTGQMSALQFDSWLGSQPYLRAGISPPLGSQPADGLAPRCDRPAVPAASTARRGPTCYDRHQHRRVFPPAHPGRTGSARKSSCSGVTTGRTTRRQ